MLRSPTPVGPGHTCHDVRPTAFRRAFRAPEYVGSHFVQDNGAQSRSLQARCLRFAGRVTPPPRKTRFRPVANLPDGIGYPPGSPQQGFSSVGLHSIPLVRVSWRKPGGPVRVRVGSGPWGGLIRDGRRVPTPSCPLPHGLGDGSGTSGTAVEARTIYGSLSPAPSGTTTYPRFSLPPR